MDYYELINELGRGVFKAVYLFWGDEDFLIEESLKKITQVLLTPEETEFNLDIFYGNEVQGSQVLQTATSYPFLGERRLVIVKDFQRMKPSCVEIINRYIARSNSSTCLVLVATKLNFRLKHYKSLKSGSVPIEFKPLYDNQVAGWIKQYLKSKNYEISEEAARLIQESIGNSLRSIVNELEKVFLILDDRQKIMADDIRHVVGATRGYSVFELSDFIGAKQLDAAITTVSRMLELGESPIGILTMLTRFFGILLKIKHFSKINGNQGKIAAGAGVPSFFVNDYLKQSRNFSTKQLQNAFHLLLEADVALKSSAQKPRLILELLIIQLIKGNQELSI